MRVLDEPRAGDRLALAPAGTVRPVRDTRPGTAEAPRLDPRCYQIAVLSLLLGYGMVWLHLEIDPGRAAVILGAALLAQLAGDALAGRPGFDPRSALISGLSLCLLLRTSEPGLAALAAVVAVASKFVLRVRGKHVFNPTNLAIVLMLLAGGPVWVSAGQWGSVAVFAFLLASAGGLVVNRAARADVAWTFLACWAALLFGRSLWLGDPMEIPLHRLQNGALVLFSFFMISDPRTTPDARAGRILFAAIVALGAYGLQFRLFWTNALLWSLCACSVLVPLIDRLLPGERYRWQRSPGPPAGQERSTP